MKISSHKDLNNTPQVKGSGIKKFRQIASLFFIHNSTRVLALIALIILVVGYFWLINPKYKQVTELNIISQNKKEADYLASKKQLDELNRLISGHKNISQVDIRRIELALPAEGLPEEIFTQLEFIAKSLGLIIDSIEVEVEEEDDKKIVKKKDESDKSYEFNLPSEIKRIRASLDVKGLNYIGLRNLINALENNLRLMDISSVKYDVSNESVTLELFTYYLAEDLNVESNNY